MMPGAGHMAIYFLIVLLIGSAVTMCMAPARAQSGQHGDGHAQMHGVYKEWRQPSNPAVSCCNDADCRPTRAYVGEDGLWRAWNGLKWRWRLGNGRAW